MVISTGPEGENVLERPGKVVSRVGIDSLEEAEGDPDVHGRDMEVTTRVDGPEDGSHQGAEGEDEGFQWVSVLCSETEGSGVFVVELVDVAV